jgi:amino acid adenylation domain-containing protein
MNQLLNIDKHVKRVNSIDILSSKEKEQLLIDFSATQADYPKDKCIVDLFHEQVLRTPNALALVFEDKKLNYAELNARSNQLAHYLKSNGIKAEMLVPICLEQGLDMVVVILAVLKTGAAYVPIDPDYPEGRISYILKDTKAKIVICGGLSIAKKFFDSKVIDIKRDSYFINKEPQSIYSVKVAPQHLAYVIYTSGSTGKPKGVMIEHKSLVNYIFHSKARYINGRTVNAGSFSHLSYTFDASLIALFTPLLSGKFLVIGVNRSIEAFKDKNLEKYAPYDFITITPSHIGLLPTAFRSQNGSWLTGKLVIGGEMLRLGQFDPFIKEGINLEVINEYGPTEATVACTSYSFFTFGDNELMQNEVPIGKPIPNTRIYIISKNGGLSSIGAIGEIFIGGTGLARGYMNLAKLTAERFIKDPFSRETGSRLFKTGDWGRWLPDGNIEYFGRIDDQVKIRGYRIEPGEIEKVLNDSRLVKQGVVLAKNDSSGNKQLVAYVVALGVFDKQALQDYVRSKLPDYMVPTLWIKQDSIPLTPNGKIDRQALREPELTDSAVEYVAPRNATETALAGVWQELLGLKRIGIYDNFFELGGHSLLAMRAISFLSKDLNMDLNFRDLFVHPSIDGLINHVQSKNKTTSQLLIPIRGAGNKTPLYIICGVGGTVFQFVNFVKMLDIEQPVYGLQQPMNSEHLEEFPKTIEGIAEIYLKEILKQQPNGPYALSGHCVGGNIAFEMAQQLKSMGEEVAMLSMFDPYATEEEIIPVSFNKYYRLSGIIKNSLSKIILKIKFETFLLLRHPKYNFQYKIEKVKSITGISKIKPGDIEMASFNEVSKVFEKAVQSYKMKHYEGDVLVFYAKEHYYFGDWNRRIFYKSISISNDTKNSWKRHAKSVSIYEIDGEHSTIFDPEHAAGLAEIVQNCLDRINIASNENPQV